MKLSKSDIGFKLRLDASNSYVYVPSSASGHTPNAWTRALKAAIPRPSDFIAHPIVSEAGTSDKLIVKAIRDGLPSSDALQIEYKRATDTGSVLIPVTFPYSKFLCITYNGAGTLSVYEDGIVAASVSDAVDTASDNSQVIFGSSTLNIPGLEVDSYNRSDFMVNDPASAFTGNVGAWGFDDGADTIVSDSALGNNGTAYNDFTWVLKEPTTTVQHLSAMLGLLATQFRGQPNIEKLLTAIAPSLQELEHVFHEILVHTHLDYATSSILDLIGEEHGEERAGRSDADYRAAIAVREAVNSAGGQPEVLIGLVERVTKGLALYSELYPATVEMYSAGKLIPSKLHSVVGSAVPGGVQLALIQGANPFVFDGDTSGAGFSEVNMTVDGLFTEVFQQ